MHRAHHGPFLGPRGLLGEHAGPEAERSLREVMKHHGPHLREHGRALRDARRAVATALSAEQFDPKALEAALSALRQQTAESQQRMHGALMELAPTLDREQRE